MPTAGLHVTEVARLLQIRRVVVPNVAAVLSAWGMLATDLRYEMVRSHVSEATRMTPAGLRQILQRMEAEGRARLTGFSGEIAVRHSLDMRYGEQIFEISVPIDGVDLAAPDVIDEVVARFHRGHEELYAYSAPGQEVVVVNARVAVIGRLPELRAEPERAESRGPVTPTRRRVYLGDWTEVPVYKLDGLPPGLQIKGAPSSSRPPRPC
jgi:N-methylhydantoinase A